MEISSDATQMRSRSGAGKGSRGGELKAVPLAAAHQIADKDTDGRHSLDNVTRSLSFACVHSADLFFERRFISFLTWYPDTYLLRVSIVVSSWLGSAELMSCRSAVLLRLVSSALVTVIY